MNPVHSMSAERGFQRHLMGLLSLVVLAVMGIVAILIWSEYETAIHSAEGRTRDYAAILESRLQTALRRADSDLYELTHVVPAAALSQQAVPRYAGELNANLDDRMVNYSEMAGFRIADRNGDTLYASASVRTPRVNVADRSYFRLLRDKPQAGLVFSEVVTGRSSGRQVMVLARALTDAQGNFLGIAYGLLELENFQKLFQSLALGPRDLITVRRSDDHRLLLRQPHLAREINMPLKPGHAVVKAIAAGDRAATLQLAAQSDGVKRIFSYKMLDLYPFYVNVGLSRDGVLAEWRSRSLVIGASSLLMLGLLAALMVRLSRAMAREAQVACELKESERFAHAELDALSSNIAVLDADGRIVATNRRWREFAEQNGQTPESVSEGSDYLGACQREGVIGGEGAAAAVALIRELINGQRQEGSFEYPCHAPHEQRWFACHGTRFAGDGPVRVVLAHENITPQLQAQQALRDSESNLRQLLDSMLEGCQIIGFDGRYRYLNDAAQAHNRRPRGDFLGKTMMECWPDLGASELAVQLKTCMEQRTVHRRDYEVAYPDGSKGWFRLIVQPVAEGLALFSEDILLRKLTESGLKTLASGPIGDAFLRHATQELARLLNVEYAFVVETGAQSQQLTMRTMWSDGQWMPGFLYDVTGTPCEDVLGRELRIFPADVQQQFPSAALLATMGIASFAAAPLWSTDHAPLGLLGIMSRRPLDNSDSVRVLLQLFTIRVAAELQRDQSMAEIARVRDQLGLAHAALQQINQDLEARVRERTAELQQANATLLGKEEEIRSVFENLADCVISIDECGVIQSANHAVERILGYGVAEVIGRNVSMLMPEPDRGAHDGYLERYVRTGEARIIGIGREVAGLHKDGTRIAMELSVNEYVVHGQRFFTGILRDIRERVRIMRDLEQARLDAEQASRVKSAFLAAMSHEIRTPMNGVVGMVDVLHQTSLQGHQVQIVNTIRESAYSLLAIIEDILDFSKIEAGKLKLEQEAMSICGVVEQVCAMMDHLAAKKGVELTLFTDPAIPALVLGDALRLRQVLINIINNAIKFSSGAQRAGKVALRARLAGRTVEGVAVEIEVIDNGIGMDEATQARLFTSFSQADVSTTRRFGGTGLGLAISGQLVQLMGGEIVVLSVPGKGSSFTARLPFFALAAQPDAPGTASQVAGLRCLVVGNAPGLADDWATYLQHDGAVVERAADLALAVGRASAHPTGLSVWIIDAGDAAPSVDTLRLAAKAGADREVRFVLIGRGQRREPRQIAPDLVVEDANVLTRQALLTAVAVAAGRAGLEDVAAEMPVGTPTAYRESGPASHAPTHDAARRQGRLILVAEDNETNREVIRQQLGLLGYAADIADDGRAALALWRGGNYALLITDLHMPEMDGYQLAEAIRAEEQGLRRTPIVALSANALAGEAERCREVGMDDYLSKPTPLEKLKATLNKWLPVVARPLPDLGAPTTAAAILDVSVLKALVGDDELRIGKLLRSFQTSLAGIATELRAACQSGQASAAGAAAHKLKSAARAVGALALGAVCDEIEQAGKADNKQTVAALLPGFEQQLAAVALALDARLQPRAPTATGPQGETLVEKSAVKVMLLDDEPFMRDLLSQLLQTLGYTSLAPYASAAAALDGLADPAGPPDLILLDLNMPDMDGIEFTRHLAQRRYAGSLVLLSGEDERTLQAARKLAQAYGIEVLGHLQKPVPAHALAALIAKWTPPSAARPETVKADYGPAAVGGAIANGELINYYQPKVELASGRVVGVETLLRWRHPTDGMVFPDQFIGVAEAHGLIDDLTRAVLRDALAQARAWRDAGLALRVAVNVSMDNLVELPFADFVVAAAAAAGVRASDLVLEVTESSLMRDLRAPLEILTRLRLHRFQLSIDDFGTGHSSLAQLRDMPFDELKIDRSFVHGAYDNPILRAIFESNLNLAQHLGIETVAEGAEDRADWDFLRRSGCDLVQGYFVARPMLAAELPGWIATWQARIKDEALCPPGANLPHDPS